MIINNTANEIGDVILAVTEAPIVGIISLSGFNESTENELSDRYFAREFRYSTNGIHFTDWIELTNENVSLITVASTDALFVHYRYTRMGTNNQGVLIWNSVELVGEFEELSCQNYQTLPRSIFKDIFCYNPEHIQLCINLTKKCYESGIIPKYIERNNSENPQVDDEDYIAFWDAICCFFALVIVFAKQFEDFTDPKLLKNFLKQRGLYFNNNTTQEQLLSLKENLNGEFFKRGTKEVYSDEGELTRLINKNEIDEFIIGPTLSTWIMGRNPLCWKGNSKEHYLNKIKDGNTINAGSLSTYHLFNSIYINQINDGGVVVNRVRGLSTGLVAGFAPNLTSLSSTDYSKATFIDNELDYEISFYLKTNNNSDLIFSLGCYGFDENNNVFQFKNPNDNTNTYYGFVDQKINIIDEYVFVRLILYNKNKNIISNSFENKNELGYGNQLKSITNIKKILPVILFKASFTNTYALIKELKIRPLVNGYTSNIEDIDNIKQGSRLKVFMNTENFYSLFLKNNSDEFNSNQVEKIIQDELLPYNSKLNFIKL